MIPTFFSIRRISFFLAILFLSEGALAQESSTLSSPDGKTVFTFLLNAKGELSYKVSYAGQPLILTSSLGTEGWRDAFVLKRVEKKQRDNTWKPVYGERAQVKDKFRGASYILWRQNQEKQQMNLEVRVYNEGVGFRYMFPGHASGKQEITIGKEYTSFVMPDGTKAWFTPTAQGVYKLLPLKAWPGQSERPLTMQLPNGKYVAIGEAGLVNYSRMKFSLDSAEANSIRCNMFDKVALTTPFATPWRVIMPAEKAVSLLANNDIYLNLNEPCPIENTSWIKPGKVIREISLSTKGAKELVDFAVKRHLQYIHFDAGWYGYEYAPESDATKVNVDPKRNPVNDLDLPAVIRYAREKGIGVFLYVNQTALAKQLDQILPLYQQWGVAGIKFGFVNVGSFRWTTWLHEAIKKCAQYHLMVDIHDEYRPTGFSRTYPNLLTQEGVRGNEEMPDATNSTVLPFTRFIAGAADHTICYYHRPELKKQLAETQNARVMKTTSGHQLALPVVFYSPLQFLYWYDKPLDSQDEPELEFFDQVPTVWDDTKVLDGEPGQYITIARRKANDWFVGTVTNTDARSLKIPLTFLTPGKKYQASIYYDDPNSKVRTKVSIKRITVNSSTVLDANLIASGGEAVWIRAL